MLMRYHMSQNRHAVGDVLHGNGKPKVDPIVEDYLEQKRPKTCLSRLNAVFTVAVPDFTRLGLEFGFIYCVDVAGPEQIHDTYWLGRIQTLRISDKRRKIIPFLRSKWEPAHLDPLCEKYWSGERSEQPFLEYLTTEATVIAILSSDPIPAQTTGGWKPSALPKNSV